MKNAITKQNRVISKQSSIHKLKEPTSLNISTPREHTIPFSLFSTIFFLFNKRNINKRN